MVIDIQDTIVIVISVSIVTSTITVSVNRFTSIEWEGILGISHTIARKVVRERVSILVNDAAVDQRFKFASSIQNLQIRSILCVPLWLGERVLGLIYLDHMMHAYAFSEPDRDLMVAVANVAALGLERHL